MHNIATGKPVESPPWLLDESTSLDVCDYRWRLPAIVAVAGGRAASTLARLSPFQAVEQGELVVAVTGGRAGQQERLAPLRARGEVHWWPLPLFLSLTAYLILICLSDGLCAYLYIVACCLYQLLSGACWTILVMYFIVAQDTKLWIAF